MNKGELEGYCDCHKFLWRQGSENDTQFRGYPGVSLLKERLKNK